MKKLLNLFDRYSLLVLSLLLLAFIPLYPKLPLLHVIRTWVYIRLEDFLIAFSLGILGLQVLRRKVSIQTPLTIPILIFWAVGLVSVINSIVFIGPHIQGFFTHIALLYYLRHIEYLALFFLSFWAIKLNPKSLPFVAFILSLTILGVSVYGIGQKYQGWPAFSTMNEEFAKGVPLRLPPTARVMSTFGGHYDLAAYLVLTIPIIGSLIFSTKRKILKLLFAALVALAYFVLLLTASRVSFGVYLVSISFMLWWQKKRLFIIPVLIASIVLVNFVSGASERFIKTLRYNDVIVDLSTGKPIGTLDKLEGDKAVMEKIATPDQENLPKGSGFINIPTNTSNNGQDKSLTSVELIKKKDLATGSGEVATVSGSFLIQKALVLDISITTRFQAEWPRAIEAFKRNVLLGSGYSTLTLAADGNYHRMLGETGILGTVAFLGIFLYSFAWYFTVRSSLPTFEKSLLTGIFAGILGLCLNAILIDVFEASKVAYMLWLLMGIAIAILSKYPFKHSYFDVLYRFFTNRYTQMAYVAGLVLLLYGKTVSNYFIGDDFTWLRWAAQSQIKDLVHVFTQSEGFFYRPIPKLWYFGFFSIFWLVPGAYHIGSLALFITILFLIAIILQFEKVPKVIIGFLLVTFMSLAIFHEDVIWISSQSHLLAMTSILFSVVCFYLAWKKEMVIQAKWYGIGILSMAISMLCYDPMGIAPFGIAALGIILFRRRRSALAPLVIIPFYIGLRMMSHAVGASGDYAVNISRFGLNAIGNGILYVTSYVVGPLAIEKGEILRVFLRQYAVPITILSGILFLAIVCLGYWKRSFISKIPRSILTYLTLAGIFYIPFAGLGGASDRYSLFPAPFLFIVTGLLLAILVRSRQSLFIKILPFIALIGISAWNYRELNRVMDDWKYASSVTEQTLLTIRQQYYPPKYTYTFVFVDTPIRYGRAWIFPTGLPDALWHMFRGTPFYVVQVNSIDAAFAFPHPKDTTRIILDFENGKLKQVVKEQISAL